MAFCFCCMWILITVESVTEAVAVAAAEVVEAASCTAVEL